MGNSAAIVLKHYAEIVDAKAALETGSSQAIFRRRQIDNCKPTQVQFLSGSCAGAKENEQALAAASASASSAF